jgi:hypothetical protein
MGLTKIGEEMDMAWDQDPFMRIFPPFHNEAKKQVATLKEPVLTYQSEYLSLLRIFGEDPKTPIVEFFKVLSRFTIAFQVLQSSPNFSTCMKHLNLNTCPSICHCRSVTRRSRRSERSLSWRR